MSLIRSLLLLLACLLPALGRAEGQPEWKELQQLMGKPITAPEMVGFVSRYGLRSISKGMEGSFWAPGHAYSIMFRRNAVTRIILEVGPKPKDAGGADRSLYARPLPAGLSSEDNRFSIERKLGAPTTPKGDEWIFGEYTIWVHFDEADRITALYVRRTADNR